MESELQAFDDLLKKNPKFAAFIANPTISRSDKAAKVMKTIFICVFPRTCELQLHFPIASPSQTTILQLTPQVGALIEEPKFSHVSRNLFVTLAANGRIGESAKIISAFNGTCCYRHRIPFF